jgi:hypothetical protein
MTLKFNLAMVRLDLTIEHVKGGHLPPIGPNQSEHFTRFKLKGNAFDRMISTKAFFNVLNLTSKLMAGRLLKTPGIQREDMALMKPTNPVGKNQHQK